MAVSLRAEIARFPLAEAFVIARGAKTEAACVVATIAAGSVCGRGECTPYGRYGESLESVLAQIESVRAAIESGADRRALQGLLPPGAARNALDCALWDYEAKRTGASAVQLAGLERLEPAVTAYTISVGEPAAMARAAARAAARPLLKVKLGGEGDRERLRAVRQAAPDSVLIVDANESWSQSSLESMLDFCAQMGVALVEQPLPAGADARLAAVRRPVAVCADESLHVRSDLAPLRERYDAVNVKLDKAGGLTEARALAAEARAQGFDVMVGCMVSSSLALAPAMLITHFARFVDLDGALFLARDRAHGLRYDGALVFPPSPALWG